MQPSEYIKLTAATDHDEDAYATKVAPRCKHNAELIHYVLGIGTEAGELQDVLKKAIAYGKVPDATNIKEELGDLLWYMARIMDWYGFTLESIMETNINKLKVRYAEKFTEHAALNRNLEAERKILES